MSFTFDYNSTRGLLHVRGSYNQHAMISRSRSFVTRVKRKLPQAELQMLQTVQRQYFNKNIQEKPLPQLPRSTMCCDTLISSRGLR